MALSIAMVAYTHYESDPRVRREAEILAERGDRVRVFALGKAGEPTFSKSGSVELVRVKEARYRGHNPASYLGSYGRFFAEVSARICADHLSDRFDVIHVHTMPDFMIFAGALPKISGAKLLLDMHDLMPDLYALKFGLDRAGLAARALRWVQRGSTALADAVICVHEPQYRLLLRDGVPAWKLGIVMNTADPKLFPARKKQPRIQEDGTIRLVYHGAILHRFGVDLAVEALAIARKTEPRLVLDIYGDGDFLEVVKVKGRAHGLGPDVLRFSEQRLSTPEVAEKIRDAHLGLVPNRDDQEDSVLPNKLLEYVAVGIPVIASETRCIRHYFDATQIEMVPVEDPASLAQAILRLAGDDKRRSAMVAAARSWEDRYGFETQKRLLCRTIDHLCAERVRAERQARQQDIEGKKTGTRSAPPKEAAGRTPDVDQGA